MSLCDCIAAIVQTEEHNILCEQHKRCSNVGAIRRRRKKSRGPTLYDVLSMDFYNDIRFVSFDQQVTARTLVLHTYTVPHTGLHNAIMCVFFCATCAPAAHVYICIFGCVMLHIEFICCSSISTKANLSRRVKKYVYTRRGRSVRWDQASHTQHMLMHTYFFFCSCITTANASQQRSDWENRENWKCL